MSRKRVPGLKSSNTISEYTAESIREMQRCSVDPIYFIENYIYIKHPMRGKIKFKMYEYQKDIIRMYLASRSCILLSARQTGKTETTCAFLLWESIFKSDWTILIASNKSSNAMEIIAKIQYAYEELPNWLKPGIDENSWNKHECKFDNKSRIVSSSTSKDSGRGMALSRIYCDELAFVSAHIQQEFWDSILPTISTGGSIIITSTPNGDSNLFAQLWRGAVLGTNSFAKGYKHIKWDDPPDRNEVFKDKMVGDLGERKWRQEYECEFLSSDLTLIDYPCITARERELKEFKPAFVHAGQFFYKKINPNATYIATLDPASGNGEDYSVIEVFEFPAMEQVCEIRTNTLTIPIVYTMLKNVLNFIGKFTPEVYFTFESNAVGLAVAALYETDENGPNAHLVSETGKGKLGFTTSHRSKMKNCLRLKECFESGILKLYSPILLTEMKSYVRREGSYAAQPGGTDDCIASSLLLFQVLEEMATYDDKAYLTIYSKDSGVNEEWKDYSYDPDRDAPPPFLMS